MTEQAQPFPIIYDSEHVTIYVDRDGDDKRVYALDKATDVFHQYPLLNRPDHEIISDVLKRHKRNWLIDDETVVWYNNLSQR